MYTNFFKISELANNFSLVKQSGLILDIYTTN